MSSACGGLLTASAERGCGGRFHVLGGLGDAVADVEAGSTQTGGAEEGADHLAAERNERDRVPRSCQYLHKQ